MDFIPIQYYAAVGAIVAALIAGFLSLLSLVSSKDQKLSELRHEWITDFRKEIADLASETRYIKFWLEQFRLDPANKDKSAILEEKYKNAYLSISKAVTLLGLRINPNVSNKKLKELNAGIP